MKKSKKEIKTQKINYVVSRDIKNSIEFHTIILSMAVENFSYVVAIGYAGGGIWEEVLAKISTNDNWETSSGLFTTYMNDSNWRFKYDDEICNENEEKINEIDENILKNLIEELFNKYVYYDDEDDDLADIPLLNKDFLKKIENKIFDSSSSTSIYKNLSRHWQLFYKWD